MVVQRPRIEPERVPRDEWVNNVLAQFERDSIALESVYAESVANGPERWAAMYLGQLYEAAELEELLRDLKAAGIDVGLAVVRYVSARRPLHEHLR